MSRNVPLSRADAVRQFHAELLVKHDATSGDRAQLCGWSSARSQEERFAALVRSLRYTGGSIVDFGCGTGDFHAFISKFYGNVNYTGLDHDESMLAVARLAHDARFVRCGFDQVDFEPVDYVVASGIFQFRDAEDPKYYETLAKALYERSKIGFAANFLSSLRRDSEKSDHELYLSPAEVADLASGISKSWVIDHSYHPGFGDVTAAMFHAAEDPSWGRPKFSNP
ncbi:MAG TPA: methyltransferase domain-containing protein [Thermoanaerobaculia bacterium]|nr:methyltransferase domain-containing protein [Thermoanaerobaculia bacterium]